MTQRPANKVRPGDTIIERGKRLQVTGIERKGQMITLVLRDWAGHVARRRMTHTTKVTVAG